jgi:hypothetical protein
MLRRKRIRLFRITLAGLFVLVAGMALLPAGFAHAASTTQRTSSHSTPAQLRKLAMRAEARAAAARKAADRAEIAAATADANLTLAEASSSNISRLSPIATPQLIAPQMGDPAVAQAQTQLQFAQQREQQAALGVSAVPFGPPPFGAPSSPILDTLAQSQLQSAKTATFMAQQNLAAARQTANMNAQASSLGSTFTATGLGDAQRNLATARALAESADRAAKAAELNAQALAEDADRAAAAATASKP